MAARFETMTRLIVEGQPLLVGVIENPTIDDVVMVEARIQAASIDRRDTAILDRRVERSIRDYLIRLGVER